MKIKKNPLVFDFESTILAHFEDLAFSRSINKKQA